MTLQEQQLLQGLTDRVNQQVLSDKDPDAEQYLQQSLGRNPDALYLLAQTVLVQQYALEQAKQQIDQLKQQSQQQAPPPQKHTSFLGNLLGMNDEPAPPPRMQSQPQYVPVSNYPPANYAPPANYGVPPYGIPQPMPYDQVQAPPQPGGGFLRSAMTTAAGVAAGAMAFQGIESLMNGFGHHAGYGGGSGFGDLGGGGQPREEVINNYYGDSDRSESHHFGDNIDNTLSPDIEDRRDDRSRSFTDTSDDDSSDFDSSGDDSSDDSSSGDDDSN